MNRWLLIFIIVGLALIVKFHDSSPLSSLPPQEISYEKPVYPEHTDADGVPIGRDYPGAVSAPIILHLRGADK